MSELSVLFPEPEVIRMNGRRIKIYPVRLPDFELYGKSAAALLELMSGASIQQNNAYASSNAREIRKILRATTSLTRWQLFRTPAQTAIELLVQVVRVNSSFFADALPGMVGALTGAQSSSD